MNLKISQSEKQQILEMHKRAVKNNLWEQNATQPTGQDTIQPKPSDPAPINVLPQEIQNFVKTYGLTGTFNYAGRGGQLGIEFGYSKDGKGQGGFTADEVKTYEEHKGDLQKCIERDKKYKEILNGLMTGTNTNNQDPRMAEYCKVRPSDPKCEGNNGGGKRMDQRQAQMEADKQINTLYPNMEYCGVVQKMQRYVNLK